MSRWPRGRIFCALGCKVLPLAEASLPRCGVWPAKRGKVMRWEHPEYPEFGSREPPHSRGGNSQRLRTELAIALYALGALSLGKAAELAETNRMAFGELVGQGGIARHYGDAELAQDLSYARSE
jgi:predicted HTH domain antitoxin